MRIFIALDIPAEIRARMVEFMERARHYASDARWARPEGLHVTLKFVGEVKEDKLEGIKSALAVVKADPFPVTFSDAGFFPNSKSPRVFWIGVAGGESLTQLAAAVDKATHNAGVVKEERAYSPHLTLARAVEHQLKPLASFVATAPVPQFGTMTAEEFWLYQSQPQRGGSKYTKLQRFQIAAGR